MQMTTCDAEFGITYIIGAPPSLSVVLARASGFDRVGQGCLQLHRLFDRCLCVQHETIYVGDKRVSIKTSLLEEKATAVNMLCCYADELKEGFYPYVEQVMLFCS